MWVELGRPLELRGCWHTHQPLRNILGGREEGGRKGGRRERGREGG